MEKEQEGGVLDPTREEIVKQFNEQEYGISDVSEDTEPSPEEEDTEPPSEMVETEPTPGEVEPDSPKEFVKENEIERNLKAALSEERHRRKDATARQKELEDQNNILLEDIKKMLSKDEPEGIDDYDGALKQLRHENESLKKKVEELGSNFQKDSQARVAADLESKIVAVDKKLEKEGFAGFADFGVRLVVGELEEIAKDDPEEATYLRNPEGWEKVYKERVFPKIMTAFSNKDKLSIMDKKRNRKEGVNLVTSPGKKPETKAPVENWTIQDYMKMRDKGQLF